MGRQAYLDRIAFGRSAFEPTQSATQSPDYVQLESSQSDLPPAYQEATANNYIQLYDERGNPINPRSREYGKRLRDSQNDVLASVGVVERRRSPSEGLPGSYEDRLELLEAEDNVGNVIALTSPLIENLCTWWLGTIRDRILAFRYPKDVSFTRLVASEWAAFDKSIIYTGFAPKVVSTLSMQAIVYSTFIYRPIDRILRATHASPKIRYFFSRWKNPLETSFRLALEVLFYPISYHASLQRLGLIPASPMLPSWGSLIPFSDSSPLLPFSSQYDVSASAIDCLKATLTCPVVFVCMEHFVERWVYFVIYEAVQSSVIRPDNSDMQCRDAGDDDRGLRILGLRRPSPPLIRDAINKLLRVIGWGQPLASQSNERKPYTESTHTLDSNEGQILDIGATTRVTNVTPLELALARAQDQLDTVPSVAESLTIPINALDDPVRPTTPPSPTASIPDQEDNDPRIRITNREGIVEMEVHLPPRILSTHTEVADISAPVRSRHRGASRNVPSFSGNRPYHRVTQLSTEPAKFINAVVKAQIVGVALLPIRLVARRLIASHYLAGQPGYAGLPRVVKQLPGLSDLNWRSIGVEISRLALCGALEMTIDLGFWGVQYLAITSLGKHIFGWSTL